MADKDLEFQVCMQDELDATTKRLDETQQQLQRTSAQLGKAHTDAAETARLMRAMHEHTDFLRILSVTHLQPSPSRTHRLF